jgi:hypothetical protein
MTRLLRLRLPLSTDFGAGDILIWQRPGVGSKSQASREEYLGRVEAMRRRGPRPHRGGHENRSKQNKGNAQIWPMRAGGRDG